MSGFVASSRKASDTASNAMPEPAHMSGPATTDDDASAPASLAQRARAHSLRMLKGLVPRDSAIALADTDAPVGDEHFTAALCRNCGVERHAPFCGECGQKAVARFGVGDLWQEIWQQWRVFEKTLVHAAIRLLRQPGTVAREYVLGARKRHVHPLTLLLFAVGTLLVLLDRTGYLTAGQTELEGAMKVVVAWSRWSFSLGLFAVLTATWCVFRRRLGCNPVEHLVLAVYVQTLIVAANAAHLLPLLFLDTAHWVPLWRKAALWTMSPVEWLIVAVACRQFFRLDWRVDAWRIALTLAAYVAIKKLLLLAYGRVVLYAATGQIA
jgi:hypothetical protein